MRPRDHHLLLVNPVARFDRAIHRPARYRRDLTRAFAISPRTDPVTGTGNQAIATAETAGCFNGPEYGNSQATTSTSTPPRPLVTENPERPR